MLNRSLLRVTSMLFFLHMTHASTNNSVSNLFAVVATFYLTDGGSTSGGGGGCSFSDQDMARAPYFGLTAAGNQNLSKQGKACGSCYEVRCTQNPHCSGAPITITITNECPGACNNEPIHFDLSQKAFGYQAKPGQASALLKAGRINILHQGVPCPYKANINFKVEVGSNRYYLAFSVLNVNGDGDLSYVEILPSNYRQWIPMQNAHGTTWKFDIRGNTNGPYSLRLTSVESRRSITAINVLPANWAPGRYYQSNVNF